MEAFQSTTGFRGGKLEELGAHRVSVLTDEEDAPRVHRDQDHAAGVLHDLALRVPAVGEQYIVHMNDERAAPEYGVPRASRLSQCRPLRGLEGPPHGGPSGRGMLRTGCYGMQSA